MSKSLHPYIVFLPSEQKDQLLSAIFGSKAAVEILKFSLNQGISSKIYQKDLVKKLAYSNKTIIENLKSLSALEILKEDMEKTKKDGRVVWVKAYKLSDIGKWFALLLSDEKTLTQKEKREIFQNIFRKYLRWVKELASKLHVDEKILEEIFAEELK